MTKYIYSRTSTTEQNVEQQSKVLLDAYPDAELVEEQATATSMDRPVLEKLIDQLVKGDSLVVYDISRLNRKTEDFLILLKKFNELNVSVVIHSMGGQPVDTSTPIGKMILTVMASVAEMNVQLDKEKQLIGIARAQAEGKYHGRKRSASTLKKYIEVLKDMDNGFSKEKAAKANGIGIATVYRLIKEIGIDLGKVEDQYKELGES